MTSEQLATIAGVVLSLAFSYIPGLNVKFAALSGDVKRLILLGLLAAIAGTAYGLACAGLGSDLHIEIACDRNGLMQLLYAFFDAAIANQITYLLTPQTEAVKQARG